MVWYVILGFLSAFGALCGVWTLFGLLLPGSDFCHLAVSCQVGKEIATIRRFCLLREMGLLRFELTVMDSTLNPRQQRYIRRKFPYIHFCAGEAWRSGEERGRKPIESGIGDFTGNHRCGGISEL